MYDLILDGRRFSDKWLFLVLGPVAYVLAFAIFESAGPRDYITQLLGLAPFGFSVYFLSNIFIDDSIPTILRVGIVTIMGLAVGVIVQLAWNYGRRFAYLILAALLSNSCSFTLHLLIRILKD